MSKTPETQHISISPRSMIIAVVIGLVVYAMWHIHDTILVILTAVVLATFISSGVSVFERIKIPRSVSVPIMYLLGIGLIVGAVSVFIPIFVDELVGLLDLLPADSGLGNIVGFLGDGQFKQVVSSGSIAGDPFALLGQLREQFSTGNAFQSISQVFGGVINAVLVVVISFYLSMRERGVEQFLRIVTPIRYENYILDVWKRSRVKIAGWFRGQVLLALINSVMTYAALMVIGVPYAFMLSLIAFLLSLIPFGIVLATVPAVVLAFLSGGLPMTLATLVLYIVLQQIENYISQPIIIRRVTGVPSLIVLLAVVIGAQLAGLLGVILAIPVAVIVLEVINDMERRKIGELENQIKKA